VSVGAPDIATTDALYTSAQSLQLPTDNRLAPSNTVFPFHPISFPVLCIIFMLTFGCTLNSRTLVVTWISKVPGYNLG
jgi:hypothetical protein